MESSGHGVGDLKYRLGWTHPIVVSPHDPNVIYTTAERVFKTTDQGKTWAEISPDLTRNDKSKQQVSGGPIEIEGMSGYIVREGRRLGVPTPHHATIYALLKPHRAGTPGDNPAR